MQARFNTTRESQSARLAARKEEKNQTGNFYTDTVRYPELASAAGLARARLRRIARQRRIGI